MTTLHCANFKFFCVASLFSFPQLKNQNICKLGFINSTNHNPSPTHTHTKTNPSRNWTPQEERQNKAWKWIIFQCPFLLALGKHGLESMVELSRLLSRNWKAEEEERNQRKLEMLKREIGEFHFNFFWRSWRRRWREKKFGGEVGEIGQEE